MAATQSMTFEEGCNKYLEYCRQRNLREGTVGHYRQNIKIKDLDFDNNVVYVNVTKNRKPLIVPLNHTMVSILLEYLKYRHHSQRY